MTDAVAIFDRMLSRALFFASLILAGCSSAHLAGDAGSLAPFDGGPPLDAAAEDAGRGHVTCDVEVGERVGEPCFCHGPATRFGDVLYRQAIGVEVWDVSTPDAPTLVDTVDEPPGSTGGLAVVDGRHLLSVGNIEPALRVYALDDPRRPRLVATLPLPDRAPAGVVASDGFAVVLASGDFVDGTLIGVDLARPEAPAVAWEAPVEGRVTAAVIDGERLWLTTRQLSPTRADLEGRAIVSGALFTRRRLEEGDGTPCFSDLAMHRGRLLRTTAGAVEILDVGGATPAVIARYPVDDAYPLSIAVDGDLAVLGGAGVIVLDLGDHARLRELGRADVPLGDLHGLDLDAGHAFASNGNGLAPITLRCE